MDIKKKRKKTGLIIAGIILLSGLSSTAYYFSSALNYHETLPADPPKQELGDASDIGTGGAIYIAFLGIDKTEERESWLGVYRTDAISIIKVDLDNKKVKLLSIPRDTYTYVPIEGKEDKINHAYAYGSQNGMAEGVKASIDAINGLLKQPTINYYFLIDMEPIPKIVDDVGGVKLDVEIDMKTHGANLSKGLQVLNGQQAYDYIHWRYSPGGDIDRIQRQQKFAKTLLKQQRDSGKVIETAQIILKYRKNFITDLSTKQIIGLAYFLKDIPDGSVTFSYIHGRGQTINGVSYWMPDKSETEDVLKEFFED